MKERFEKSTKRPWATAFIIGAVAFGMSACEPPAPTESSSEFEAVMGQAQLGGPETPAFVPITKERPAIFYINGTRYESLDDVEFSMEAVDPASISIRHLPLAVQRAKYGETQRRVVEMRLRFREGR